MALLLVIQELISTIWPPTELGFFPFASLLTRGCLLPARGWASSPSPARPAYYGSSGTTPELLGLRW